MSMTTEQKKAEYERFNAAADEDVFTPDEISAVLDVSLSWLQKKRCEGGGIPFTKIHYRKIVYKKADVLSYINKHRVNSTSQLRAV